MLKFYECYESGIYYDSFTYIYLYEAKGMND